MDDAGTRFHFSEARRILSPNESPKVAARALNVFYGDKQALFDVHLDIPDRAVTALMGPSGCGKSTFLRCVNRLNDLEPTCRVTGSVKIDGVDIYSRNVDSTLVRARIGMVFQKPVPFPKSVYENVAYGPQIQRLARNRAHLDEIVERSLVRAGLWQEVKDRLGSNALALSGGQQQRLIIARALAVEPEVLLMDEPCSAIDPTATAVIEKLIDELREHYCIVLVTHSLAQAARMSQFAAYFHLGVLVESGRTEELFTNPKDERVRNYVQGRVG